MKNQNFFWFLLSSLSGFLIAGIILLLLVQKDSQPIRIIPAPTPEPLKVYLSGEVNNPGVYSLPQNSRLEDLFEAAKVTSYPVEQYNLSSKLYDGQHIHVGTSTTITRNQNVIEIQSDKININEASVEQLDELPGIGEVKAREIVQYRETFGYFDRIEDILNVPGIGETTFNQFKDFIETNSVN